MGYFHKDLVNMERSMRPRYPGKTGNLAGRRVYFALVLSSSCGKELWPLGKPIHFLILPSLPVSVQHLEVILVVEAHIDLFALVLI